MQILKTMLSNKTKVKTVIAEITVVAIFFTFFGKNSLRICAFCVFIKGRHVK